jgi:UPF0755 protein
MAIAALVLFALDFGLSAPSRFPKDERLFTVSTGEALKTIAIRLKDEHYVRSVFMFSTMVTLFGGEHRISPGDYHFSRGESVLGVARQIARGDHDIKPIKITVPEGQTVKEMAALFSEKLPDFDTDAFILAATPQEGYLFPETYFFYPKTVPAEIVKEMRAMFDRQTVQVFSEAAPAEYSFNEVVVMASLIEREAHGSDDRDIIAGILYKRLALRMRLQLDATVGSAYDTYLKAGLPPTPIANPGMEALEAALNPAKTDYLYYLHDKNGSIHYAKTYAEHQKNIARYLK